MQLSLIPRLSWAALAVSVVGFFVSFATISTTSTNGQVTACSTFDFVPIVVAGLSLVLAVAAYGERRRKHEKFRLPMPWMHGWTALIAVLAVVHLLRAFGVIGSAC